MKYSQVSIPLPETCDANDIVLIVQDGHYTTRHLEHVGFLIEIPNLQPDHVIQSSRSILTSVFKPHVQPIHGWLSLT